MEAAGSREWQAMFGGDMEAHIRAEGGFIDGTTADGDILYHTYQLNLATGNMDPVQHVAFGAMDGSMATGSMLIGLGAVETTGWGVSITNVSFASTFGALGLTVAGVLLPTAAGAGSTQRANGIKGAKEILGNKSYPGPWSYTYRPPFQDPINLEFNNFNPDNMPPDWKGMGKLFLGGMALYQIYDEYKSHMDNLFPLNPVDNTNVYPQFHPSFPWSR